MKIIHFPILCLAALTLAACGNGSSSPIPNPGMISTPKPVVQFVVSSLGSATQAWRKAASASSCSATVPPVALQAEANYSPPPGSSSAALIGNQIAATEYDSACNVISTSATYTIGSTAIATSSAPAWANIPSPAPGAINVSGVGPGTTPITATFPDKTTANLTADVYGQLGISCAGGTYYLGGTPAVYAEAGWSASSGYAFNVNACGMTFGTPATGLDMQEDPGGNAIDFPYGYDVLQSGNTGHDPTLLSGITDCSSFTSQGTVLQLNPYAVPLPPMPFLILFKTSTGACVKWYLQMQSADNGSPSWVGLYAVSDSAGKFAY